MRSFDAIVTPNLNYDALVYRSVNEGVTPNTYTFKYLGLFAISVELKVRPLFRETTVIHNLSASPTAALTLFKLSQSN